MSTDPLLAGPLQEVTCPRCRQRTDRIQSYHVPVVVFLLIYIAWTSEQIAGCPSCVRTRLRRLFWFSVPGANLLFPIVGLWIFSALVSSKQNDRPGIPPRYAEWASLPTAGESRPIEDRGKAARLVIVLGLLVAVVVFVFVVLPRLVR